MSRVRRGLTAAAVAAVMIALATGCSAGQITQTDTKKPSVPGANKAVRLAGGGEVGIRNAVLEYPGPAGYATGAQAPISVRVFNSGGTAVRLVGVASNAGEVVLFTDSHGSGGGVAAPTRSAVASRPASATPASSPAAPTATPTVSSSPSPKAATGPINLEIPAGGFVALDPNLTQYLMISALTKDVRPGEAIALTFRFSTGDQLTDVQVPMAVPVTPAPRSPMDLERTES